MKITISAALALGLSAGASGAATLGTTATALSLSDGGRTLVTLAGPAGGATVALRDPEGKAVRLDDIDWRPATGELFGYSDATDTVYLIDRATGLATPRASLEKATKTRMAGFDFNNAIDAARVVSANEDNLVFNPKTEPNTFARFTDLFYVPGDANEGRDPGVAMNAYTNAFAGATTTTQYVIDVSLDALATLGNNAGTLSTVGVFHLDGMRFDVGSTGGFDILSLMPGQNMALALLTTGKGAVQSQGIYGFDLAADAMGRVNLTRLFDLGTGKAQFDGLAVIPQPAPVPLPASALLLVAGLAGLGAVARRRR